jgi:hypothetical protein
MKTGVLILLVLIAGLFSVRADDDSAALEKLRKIPIPPALANIDEDKLTPVLVLTARGAFINDSKTPVSFHQVLKALAALPRKAWSYGRAILYYSSPYGNSNPGDWPNPADAKKVEVDLKAADVELIPGISN